MTSRSGSTLSPAEPKKSVRLGRVSGIIHMVLETSLWPLAYYGTWGTVSTQPSADLGAQKRTPQKPGTPVRRQYRYQPLRTATLHPVAIAVDELQRRLGGRCCKLGLNHRFGRCPKDPGWLVRLPRRQLLVFAVACRRCPFPLVAGVHMASTQSTPPVHWYPDRTTRPRRRWSRL